MKQQTTLGHALFHQLVFADGESMGEKANRIFIPEPLPIPRKVSIEEFEADRSPKVEER